VFSTVSVEEAEQVRAFLEAAGVSSFLRGESLSKTHSIRLPGRWGKLEVVVSEGDEERARALLASADAGEFRLDEDSET
jgi:hypothetical protein